MEDGLRTRTRLRRQVFAPQGRVRIVQRIPAAVLALALCSLCAVGCGDLRAAALQDGEASPVADASDGPTDESAGDTARRPNRLARESSPYLLLHAHNPVDWYPWGPEAFERARREGKPILLSIGYTSCHWCHVMERLVFENAAIAAYMNEHFVNVKVDREERPDVDEIYMTALQVYYQLAGSRQSGGWPLSMFLTPDGKPIAGGTYFPPETKDGRVGFPDVMRKMVEVWSQHRQGVEGNAELISREVRRLMQPQLNLKPRPLDTSLVEAATKAVVDSYDPEYGGVGFDPAHPHSPKFPTPPKLALLQHAAAGSDNESAGKIVRHTLDAIAAGGIRDHLGGGFHRYSTDREWLVPHFEKMLYDQAQLARLYVEAFARTGEHRDREVAEGTLDFVLRELMDPEGGFHSALDAETEGIEGKYYVWSREEVERILGLDDARLFMQAYGMNDESPFEHGYVLHRPQPLDRLAADVNVDPAELERGLAEMRVKLLAARQERPPLLRDDKVLTSWNGLMIGTLARAGDVLDRPDYLAAAERAAVFVLANMRDDQKRLQRTWRGGRASLNAYLDDYAFLIQGLLDLHDAAAEDPRADASRWLNAAVRLTDQQIELFWDETGKAFYFTSHDHEELLARTKNAYSSVIPSGNGVAARNLLRIAALTGQEKYRVHARQTLETFIGELENSPGGMADFTLALAELLEESGAASDAPQEPPAAKPAAEPPLESSEADPSTANATGILQAAGETPTPRAGDPEIVTAKAFLDVDKLPIGGTARIVVFLEISAGWHINTNPAQPENLIPTKFTIQSEVGTELSGVKYPAGKKLEVEGIDEPVLVYENRAILRGTLTVPRDAAAAADEIELRIRYQPCNDRQCLSPRTLKLNGRVPLARAGEPVKAINQNLFPKPGEEGRAAPRARGVEPRE